MLPVGIEPNMTRVKISYPKPLDDRAIVTTKIEGV